MNDFNIRMTSKNLGLKNFGHTLRKFYNMIYIQSHNVPAGLKFLNGTNVFKTIRKVKRCQVMHLIK